MQDILKVFDQTGSTYLGVGEKHGRKVVIKRLSNELASNPEYLASFIGEAEIEVKHPNIARPLEYVKYNDDHYIIREYIEGYSLADILKNRRLKIKSPAFFYVQCFINVSDGIEELHNHGYVHRDIRPSNMILSLSKSKMIDYENPVVKLIDLGLARKIREPLNTEQKPVTQLYSPPEQILDFPELINETSDIYSLGVSMYEMIIRKPPFVHNNITELSEMQLTQDIPYNAKFPETLFQTISIACQKIKMQPPLHKFTHEEIRKIILEGQKRRFQNATEFKSALMDSYRIMMQIKEQPSSWKKNLSWIWE